MSHATGDPNITDQSTLVDPEPSCRSPFPVIQGHRHEQHHRGDGDEHVAGPRGQPLVRLGESTSSSIIGVASGHSSSPRVLASAFLMGPMSIPNR
jgi:hypothetical protein